MSASIIAPRAGAGRLNKVNPSLPHARESAFVRVSLKSRQHPIPHPSARSQRRGPHLQAGNTADSTTLRDFLSRIERQYGKARRTWVMDRGLHSAAAWIDNISR